MLTVALLACSPSVDSAPTDELVAVVDGYAITRSMYTEYLSVFEDPDGVVHASPEQVLVSLINQALTHAEAIERGISISPEVVDANLEASGLLDVHANQIDRAGGLDALKTRVAAFLELDAVREAVISELTSPETPQPGDLTGSILRQQQWSEWLRTRRQCAHITVFDVSLGVCSSTPAADCPGALETGQAARTSL